MPAQVLEEPFDSVVSVIAHGFKLRRGDAMARAIKQVKEWRVRRRAAIARGDMPSSRALRAHYRSLEILIQKNVNRYHPKDGSFGPTPEQLSRPPARDSIQSLEDAGRITGEQAAAAREIQRIVEVITAGVHPKCQTYQKGAEGYRPGGFMSAETAYRWSQVYVPWHAAMKARSDKRLKKLAEMVIIDGFSLDTSRRHLKMSYERGHLYLTESIDLYIEIKERDQSHPAHERIRQEAEACG